MNPSIRQLALLEVIAYLPEPRLFIEPLVEKYGEHIREQLPKELDRIRDELVAACNCTRGRSSISKIA